MAKNRLDNTSDSEKQRERGRKGARKKGQLCTPQWRQNQVLALHLAGKAYRQIAKELHMTTRTITNILSQPEVRELKEQYRQRVLCRSSSSRPMHNRSQGQKPSRSQGRLVTTMQKSDAEGRKPVDSRPYTVNGDAAPLWG